ncbi:MAG: hypothetical protein HKM04_03425 [Legionellales bacterium]|nr:hypothetical protein [Legionellales bacterium]
MITFWPTYLTKLSDHLFSMNFDPVKNNTHTIVSSNEGAILLHELARISDLAAVSTLLPLIPDDMLLLEEVNKMVSLKVAMSEACLPIVKLVLHSKLVNYDFEKLSDPSYRNNYYSNNSVNDAFSYNFGKISSIIEKLKAESPIKLVI